MSQCLNFLSFCSSTSDCNSSLCPSHHQTNELRQPHWLLTSVQQSETEAGQSQTSISCSAGPQDDAGQEEKAAKQGQTRTDLSPARSLDGSSMMTPLVTSGPGYTSPDQASPNSATGRSSRLQAASEQPVRRYRLSLCLPSCLQAEDRS